MDTHRIRELNDAFRGNLAGGKVMLTPGVSELPEENLHQLMLSVCTFSAFTAGNDPHGEHDFGGIEIEGCTYFWKIDYYDRSLEYGSPDPSDPAVTTRVLTIMRADEY